MKDIQAMPIPSANQRFFEAENQDIPDTILIAQI
jgi:hypothetical protein